MELAILRSLKGIKDDGFFLLLHFIIINGEGIKIEICGNLSIDYELFNNYIILCFIIFKHTHSPLLPHTHIP